MTDVEHLAPVDLESTFSDADVTASFHALDLRSRNEIAYHADDLVIPGSVFKLPVLLELFRQHYAGEVDASAPVAVPVEGRAFGPNGLSVMRDPVTMSLRDLAWQMMGISDNAATDVICEHLGLDNINASLTRLGLINTRIGGDCRALFTMMLHDAGIATFDEFPAEPTRELLDAQRALDPARSRNQTTARDTTRLLQLIWDDQAAPAAACAEARRILGLQVWPHRLAAGFPEDAVRTSGKTGTLPTIRNEVGVVEYPDGGRYAVAVFTRSNSRTSKNQAADAVIGRAARLAVENLRRIP